MHRVPQQHLGRRWRHGESAWIGSLALGFIVAPALCQQTQLPSTVEDFFEPGTQELMLNAPMIEATACGWCHGYENDGNKAEIVAPYNNWTMSLMAHAARDPVWHAALAIANQDADFGGDTCIRCHSPNAWLDGRSVPTDASGFAATADWDGVSCNFCHRLVDPVTSKSNPPEDGPILDALELAGLLPSAPGNARYVVDPDDTRRGPLDDVPENYHGVPIIVSPFHRSANLCGTCHDVSNALYTRQGDGSYTLNTFNDAHPTLGPHDMMPEQRTYSEWLNSSFASSGVYFPDRRFGGDHPTGIMQSCQDCHMPKHSGGLCAFWENPPFFVRPDVAEHSFIGANTWVLGAVYDLYGGGETALTEDSIAVNRARTEAMLANASDMQVARVGDQLKVRIINFSGHKLPTGYPEGRRMWLNVRFFDSAAVLLAEHGAYDFDTAVLDPGATKVYQTKFGIDAAVAAQTGLPEGQSFHLALNNVILQDNRIPPIGFTNAAFSAVRAAPVGHAYADGQYWDDTMFAIPPGSVEATVTLYYQTTSKEYIEFLRDANVTPGNTSGQVAYDAWVARGKSAPVTMDYTLLTLDGPIADLNGDGVVNVTDLLMVISAWGPCPPPDLCPEDVNSNGVVNVTDLLAVIANWG